MRSNDGYALLIGVDDYTSFDGALNLSGSRQDVIKLYWFCTAILGFPPANIRILASPALTPADLGPAAPSSEALGEATGDMIQAGVAWLAERMQSNTAPGLLTFSGHGAWSRDRGPLLCPTDVGRDLAKAVAVRDLSRSEALQKVRERLTVVLDCCHVSPAAPATDLRAHTGLPHDGIPEEVAADHADFNISDRVLLAARLGQRAHQARLGRVVHGALTFAVITVAEQWKAAQGPGATGLDISHKQLLKRTRQLLEALRMQQSPRLYTPLARRQQIRKMPFLGAQAGLTRRKADGLRESAQVDGGWKYILSLQTSDVDSLDVAYVVSTGPAQVSIQVGENDAYLADPNTECWYVNQAALADLGRYPMSVSSESLGSTVTVPSSCSGQTDSSAPVFTTPVGAGWNPTDGTVQGPGVYYMGYDASGALLYMRWGVTGTGKASDPYKLTQVMWYFGSSTVPELKPTGMFAVQTSGPSSLKGVQVGVSGAS